MTRGTLSPSNNAALIREHVWQRDLCKSDWAVLIGVVCNPLQQI